MERSSREEVTRDSIETTIIKLRDRIDHSFKKHGNGVFLNSFESLGVVQLEFDEYKKSIQEREGLERQVDELLDIATVAIVSASSIIQLQGRRK